MLDERLSLIETMVPLCRGVADVGADHGLLICQLAASGRVRWGVATDIHAKPLDKARREARSRGLESRVICLLADGLGELPPHGLDTVIIAGMGGETIAHIMGGWRHSHRPGITWLLQPMTKAERLRQWLWNHGFEIRREPCCQAGGRVYSVMEAAWTGQPRVPDTGEIYLGKVDPGAGPESLAYCREVLERARQKARGAARGENREEAALAGDTAAALEQALEQKGVRL